MTTTAFKKKLVDGLKAALRRPDVPLARVSSASREALDLCGRHADGLPKGVLDAFRKAHPDLWETGRRK